MTDDIRAMTAELASNPASLVFLQLGEALRRRGRLEAALKVAQTGAARYPGLADAHDLVARIQGDQGDLAHAFDTWQTAVELAPDHAGANKGLGFLYFRAGDYPRALGHLEAAARALPEEIGLRAAIERVRGMIDAPVVDAATAPPPATSEESFARDEALTNGTGADVAAAPGIPFALEEETPDSRLFAGFEGADDGLLLLDSRGLRLGGGLRGPGGDVSDTVAAELAGVSREAARAARLLGLGDWTSIAAECPDGNLHLAAPTSETILLTVRDPSVPAGRLALLSERAARAARRWLERLE